MTSFTAWERFTSLYWSSRSVGLGLDVSRMGLTPKTLEQHRELAARAVQAMRELEGGAIANPDEDRMVGHYWLRAPELAPSPEIRRAIDETGVRVKAFAASVREGRLTPPGGGRYEDVLLVGIGGSALGPQFLHDALGRPQAPLRIHLLDNTDPDGILRALAAIPSLAKTLTVVVSKSGGTKETRNGQILVQQAYAAAGVDYRKSFVAVTGEGSALDNIAASEGWLERFPMWDWVGGRTSLWSAVGLLPAALEGFDVDALLQGAAIMDQATRTPDLKRNPAALLALAWHQAGRGRGEKAMVVLPYKDRLLFFSRYLQQLVMESLGKEKDLSGAAVHQGLTVYGNKGSTDQHAYVQQLRDGPDNFFGVFVAVLEDLCVPLTAHESPLVQFEVEPGITSGDYLIGFLLGTREALFEKGRESILITVRRLNEQSVGALLALFERAVGLYAQYVNINAYHQPGVEAGKRAAGEILAFQRLVVELLTREAKALTVNEIVDLLNKPESAETAFVVLQHLAANGRVRVEEEENVFESRYSIAKR